MIMKPLASVFSVIALSFLPPAGAVGQNTEPSRPPVTAPIHEETLRTYFDEIHFVSWNRKMWDLQFHKQKQQLPPWYPLNVWKETTDTIESMDIVPIALPIYQKYVSDETGHHIVLFFATAQGQELAAKMFADQGRLQAAGENADDAYAQTLAADRAQEDMTVSKLLASITPAQRREIAAFVHSAEWTRMDTDGPIISREMSDALLEKQKEIVHAVAEKHRDELVRAKHTYDSEHGATGLK